MIGPGDAVVCDWGGTLEGYNSDVTRTAHVGEPSPEFVRAYEAVLAANQAAFEAVRPGVPCQEIDRAARSVLTASRVRRRLHSSYRARAGTLGA